MKLKNWGIGDTKISLALKMTVAGSHCRSRAFSSPFLKQLLEKESDLMNLRIQESSSAKDNALCTHEVEVEIRRMSDDGRKWLVPDRILRNG